MCTPANDETVRCTDGAADAEPDPKHGTSGPGEADTALKSLKDARIPVTKAAMVALAVQNCIGPCGTDIVVIGQWQYSAATITR